MLKDFAPDSCDPILAQAGACCDKDCVQDEIDALDSDCNSEESSCRSDFKDCVYTDGTGISGLQFSTCSSDKRFACRVDAVPGACNPPYVKYRDVCMARFPDTLNYDKAVKSCTLRGSMPPAEDGKLTAYRDLMLTIGRDDLRNRVHPTMYQFYTKHNDNNYRYSG